MKIFKLRFVLTALISFPLFLTCFSCTAQSRDYSIVYSDNLKGGSTIFGNTLLNIVDNGSVNLEKMNDNSSNGNGLYGNDNENLQYIDIDGNTGEGSVTKNSSTSDLELPAGNNTIKLARLYWGGFVVKNEFDLNLAVNRKIKIRKGTTNAYTEVSAVVINKVNVGDSYTQQYQAYADVTELIKKYGAGTYEVGNAPLSVGSYSAGGANGGWCIVVVYENATLNYNSVRLYDGFKEVYKGGDSLTTTVTLTGLNVPSAKIASSDAKMGVVAWEGDAKLDKDFLKINGILFSNATNQADNPWNGTITNNGVHVSTKNPDYTNQMGIDIDQFDAGTSYSISPNDTSVVLQFGTKADRYFPGLFTFTVKMKDSSASANDGTIKPESGPLPITLLSFNGNLYKNNNVILNWNTSAEINCKQYEVERSADGKTFNKVFSVAGNGTTMLQHYYSGSDNVPSEINSIVYYRLKQIDLDNNVTYSNIVAIKLIQSDTQVSVYPNPFTSSLNMDIKSDTKTTINVKLITVEGQKILTKKIELSKGNNHINIEELNKLSNGSYFLQFISSKNTLTRKITKQ